MSETVKNLCNSLLLIRIFLRSLFIQASWNFEKMQNLGFIYAIMPALKRLYGGKQDELKAAVGRHIAFFNTHPYLTAPILGATIRLEEEYSKTHEGVNEITTFKSSMMGICGGVGDSFFWGILRPFTAVVGVIIALIYQNLYAPVACFLLYNIVHLSFRASLFFSGYKNGISVTNTLKKIDLRKHTEILKKYQAFILGLLFALVKYKFMIYNFNTLFYNGLLIVGFLFAIFLLYYLVKKRLSAVLIIYIIAAVVVLSTYYEGMLWN